MQDNKTGITDIDVNENVDNIVSINDNATMSDDDASEVAAGGTAEDTTIADYESIIEKKDKQIEMLLESAKNLQNQINVLLRSGASISDVINNEVELNEPKNDADKYVSLSDLGHEMGQRRYDNVNYKEV